jgi:N-acetylmuramoyl-L-alanine amidase
MFPPVFNSAVRAGLALLMLLAALALGIASAAAQDTAPPATDLPSVLDIRVSTTPQRARLILDLSGRTEFALASLTGPDRIAVDARVTDLKIEGGQPPVAGTGIVASYTLEMADTGRARTILVLAQPALVQQAYVLDAIADQPARLVVDLVLDTPEGFAKRAAESLAAAMAMDPALVTAPPVVEAQTPPPQADLPKPEVVAETRPLVVIDPGHGGIDNGASAPNGVHEKDIVLAYALALQQLLIESGRFDVALTREDDSFLRLEERVALARANKADLFISIHADSFAQAEIRGASVYTRDENATDLLDKVLAENENRSNLVAGFALPDMPPTVVDILIDLMRRETRKESFIAAQTIVRQLQPSVELRRYPVRQADFFVLQAPDVPSVLIELGFLSNAADIVNLQREDWRSTVVGALAKGINAYFDGVEGQGQVAASR